MRTMQRAVAMVGLTLMTGGILGVTATAATAAPAQTEKTTQSTEDGRRGGDDDGRWGGDNGRRGGDDFGRRFGDRDRSYIQGWYPNRRLCQIVGWAGDHNGRWDNPRCIPGRNGGYLLKVDREHRRHWRR